MIMQRAFIFVMGVVLSIGRILGEDGSRNEKNPINQPASIFHRQFTVLGKRLKTSGKEKTVYEGQLFDKDGKSSKARVVMQLPWLVRLEGFNGNNGTVSFDGMATNSTKASKSDDSLIETFVVDFAEEMFAFVQQGAAVRLLGQGFKPDSHVAPNYKGPRYDIFEVTGPLPYRKDKLVRSKLYYFDSDTGLLQSTRYYDRSVSPPVKMETRFSVWGAIDGSAYPAKIERYEGGKLAFTFIAEDIKAGSFIDKSNFK
jgi:hypothetical protein